MQRLGKIDNVDPLLISEPLKSNTGQQEMLFLQMQHEMLLKIPE